MFYSTHMNRYEDALRQVSLQDLVSEKRLWKSATAISSSASSPGRASGACASTAAAAHRQAWPSFTSIAAPSTSAEKPVAAATGSIAFPKGGALMRTYHRSVEHRPTTIFLVTSFAELWLHGHSRCACATSFPCWLLQLYRNTVYPYDFGNF